VRTAVVFEGITALLETGDPIDTVTLTDWLARNGRLDEIGGPAALHDLTVATPTAANAAYYARIVQQKALLRRLIDAGTAVARMGYEAADEAEQVVDKAESLIYEVAQMGATSEYSQLRDLLNDSFAAIEKLAEQGSEVTGLATGFDDLDRLTSGLQPQNLVILAARPAMGKCVWGSCRVNYPKTGEWLEISELVARGRRGEPVQVAALDESGRLVAVDVEGFHDNGVQPVSRLRTRSGRSIRATSNHPFLTWHGWRELRDLAPGDLVAVPRELPYFGDQHRPDAEVKLLGYLLGDGCLREADAANSRRSPSSSRAK
jgi:replicative DNA helicase